MDLCIYVVKIILWGGCRIIYNQREGKGYSFYWRDNMKKRIIGILLSLMMIITSISVPCFAQEKKADPYASLKTGIGYVAIGDSFTRGFGASDHWREQLYESEYYGHYNCRNVDGAYPNGIAKALGLKTPNDIRNKNGQLWYLAHDAVSTAYILDLLGIDDGYRDDEFTYESEKMRRRYKTDLAYFGDPQSYNLDYNKDGTLGRYGKTGEIMSVRKMLKKANLITIQFGISDVVYKTLDRAFWTIDLNDISGAVKTIANMVKQIEENYLYWEKAFPLLLDYIHENNPNAKVVLVGAMNPVQNVVPAEDILIPLGSAFSVITDKINNYNKKCAKKYGYLYVDISNVDSPSTERTITLSELLSLKGDDFDLTIHPSLSGYAQLERIVVDAVLKYVSADSEETAEHSEGQIALDKTIKVDLGRFTKVDCVRVDGVKRKNYSMDGYVLNVPCNRRTAKEMTVSVVKEDGTITVMTYKLKYDNGYTARRTYVTNDIKGDIKTVVRSPITIPKNFIELVKSLIG